VVAYDGTRYRGWQRQPEALTIQAVMERMLHTMVKHPVTVIGASRTDAGSHALGLVANARVDTLMSTREILRAFSSLLPEDVVVRRVVEVPAAFHAQYDALGRVYRYRILNASLPDPFRRRRCYHVARRLTLGPMRRAANAFLGKQNFAALARGRDAGGGSGTVRTMRRCEVRRAGDEVVILVEADGFLRGMIRTLVQILVEVGTGRRTPESVRALLRRRDRRLAPAFAPAWGLYLVSVEYAGKG